MTIGIGEIGSATQGIGIVALDYNIAGSADVVGSQFQHGTGLVSFDSSIDGIGEIGGSTEGDGNLNYEFSINGVGETESNTVNGVGLVSFDENIFGIGEVGLGSGETYNNYPLGWRNAVGQLVFAFEIDGIGEVASATNGVGGVQSGTDLGIGEVGIATNGIGTVELIPTLAGSLTKATIAQIYEQWAIRINDPVSVTFSATPYDQACDQNTLLIMDDIVDNWSSYADLKNGANIEWGVLDGTVLTMTQSEFTTWRNDTRTAWRDQVDRVTQKARDWADTGVALSTILNSSNWS